MVFCNKFKIIGFKECKGSHNPYFNRWFSAIQDDYWDNKACSEVTILILIDGFLQSRQQKH